MKKMPEKELPIRMYKSGNNSLQRKIEVNSTVSPFAMELIFSILLITAVCALRIVHLYAGNEGKVTFADWGTSVLIYMGISAAAFAILRFFWRKPYFACTFVAFGTFLAVNIVWLLDFFRLSANKSNPAAIACIALYIVLIAGLFLLLLLLNKKSFPVRVVSRIMCVAFTCLILLNVALEFVAVGKTASGDTQVAIQSPSAEVTAKPTPISTPEPTPVPTPEPTPVPTPEPFGLPNIYYFILDEYSSFDMLSKYYDYDNKIFEEFLTMEGFNMSRESYSTDNQTMQSICDMLNLEYISRHYSESKSRRTVSKAKLFKILSDLGYSQFQLSTSSNHFEGITSLKTSDGKKAFEDIIIGGEGFTGTAPDSSISGSLSQMLAAEAAESDTEVDTDALNEWGFYPSEYIRDTKRFRKGGKADNVLNIFDYFEDPSNYAETSPRVIYSYMSASHVPFIFNEYGGLLSSSYARDWRTTSVYLNQYKYVNKHLMAIFSTIIANDPDSIIILMSDHGIRYHADCEKKHKFYITDKDSCRIMNAVYIKGQQYDIEGLSGMNTLRYILSLYEGLDYPPVEDPITSESPNRLKGIIPRPR